MTVNYRRVLFPYLFTNTIPKKIMPTMGFGIRSDPEMQIEYKVEFHYQKFRYETEKRTGKKQHTKPMMIIKCKELPDIPHKYKLYIVPVSPNKPFCVHPNKLVGKDCCDGVYHTTDVSKIKKKANGDCILEIPYLYICRTKKNAVKNSLEKMLKQLPDSVNELCKIESSSDDNVKTDSIRLRVILDIDGKMYNKLTSIITHHDSGEKVKLNINELSSYNFTSEDKNYIWIFTEDIIGPDIKQGEFEVQMITDNWESKPYILKNGDISYKRAIKYVVPECKDSCIQTGDVKGKLVLRCLINNLTSDRDIVFIQSKLHKKRKALRDRQYDIKRLCLEKGQSSSEISQDSDMPTSNNNRETATSDNYRLLQNNGGKTFVPESEPSTFKPALQKPTPQTYVPQQPTSENASTALTMEFSSNAVSQQPSSEIVSIDYLANDLVNDNVGAQEMESDSSQLYLTYDNIDNNPSQGSQARIHEASDTSHAGSSFGMSGDQNWYDSKYKEFNQGVGSSLQAESSDVSTSYRPEVEPVTPVIFGSTLDILAESVQLSGIPDNSSQNTNHVEGTSFQREVQLHPENFDMKKSVSPPGSSMELLPQVDFDFNLSSIDIVAGCTELLEASAVDYQKDLQLKK
ncbi:hypothetical protein LOTGIDRAFT_232334 [Lottia gigantea]|uniref:RHD domain-containing protein n=1 Tax=Lottia gigantea TaxID=225164 RepID=V4BZC8_LOTGI|nr:hypothetical protein LOTGIDRAFT_232334 [Lottia gigantea]ESO94499.1 hypothetical protein LOTGIDRAFT_232334 [Lottia gigantea]